MIKTQRYIQKLLAIPRSTSDPVSRSFSDFIFEGGPIDETYVVQQVLPQEFSTAYIANIPGIPLPRNKFLYYCRAETRIVIQLLESPEFQHMFLAESWENLFETDYAHWGYVFDVESIRKSTNGTLNWRGKFSELTQNDEVVGVNVPGVFAGDNAPKLELNDWVFETWTPKIIQEPQELVNIVDVVNEELMKYLLHHPQELYRLRPRQFEELVCEILHGFGWQVELTPPTKDGGYDIFGISKDISGARTTWLVECKKYAPENKVGVEIVRSICGVKSHLRVANAIIATTSFFTKGAIDIKTSRYDLELKNYNDIMNWLRLRNG